MPHECRDLRKFILLSLSALNMEKQAGCIHRKIEERGFFHKNNGYLLEVNEQVNP